MHSGIPGASEKVPCDGDQVADSLFLRQVEGRQGKGRGFLFSPVPWQAGRQAGGGPDPVPCTDQDQEPMSCEAADLAVLGSWIDKAEP